MELFGDESGHLRSLLDGDCNLFVISLVAGDPARCRACPKRAVRNVQDISEARWCDLTEIQKRRMIDCLVDCGADLSYGYVAIEHADLHDLERHYRLYEDDLRYAWDLCIIGDCYAELAGQLIDGRASDCRLTFDRFMSQKMSDRIIEVIHETRSDLVVEHGNSRQVGGIQTADCFAGAVREHLQEDEDWLDSFDDNLVTCGTNYALAGVEHRLFAEETAP